VQEQSKDSELKSNAQFKIGMMYQFGQGGVVEINHDLAQIFYEKALKEKTSVSAPVYLLSLYSKWQRLEIVDTVKSFFSEAIEEPWSKGALLLAVQVCYVLFVCGTVKFLRKENQR
jgi:TPR repeat protein